MSFIYVPFSYLMKGCLWIAGNYYILALLFFAIAMELILLPLKIKQQKSQIKMAQIKPKEMAIREKYKGRTDRVTQQKMTMEIQEMYQANGYNQFSGCLPLLIQLPIIFILFAIVRNPITYASNIGGGDEAFIKDKATAAVEFYEEAKNSLIKDAFESEEDYNGLVNQYATYQQLIGGKNNEDKKSEAGHLVYEFGGTLGSAAEMEISRLMIDGKETFEALVAEGKIGESILTSYNEKKFGEYKDDLPEYHIGSVNLLDEPDLGKTDSVNIWLLLIPLLTFLTSFLSTKLTKKVNGTNQTDANGNPIGGGLFMEVGMPIITAIFTFNFVGAIGVYWIWRTVVSMVETVIIAKIMPIPKVTEEQIAEARKEMKSKQKKKKVITIEVDEDDDSYDDLVVRRSDRSSSNSSEGSDPARRTPRKIEMLTADDDEDIVNEASDEADTGSDSEE